MNEQTLAPLAASTALAALWGSAGLSPSALQRAQLTGSEPALPSSFAVGTAAQVSAAAAGLAATEIGLHRNGLAQTISVDMRHAALEACAYYTLDGKVPVLWDKLAGLYRCGSDRSSGGWVRLHTNFAHHRDGVLRLLGLPEGADTPRESVASALADRDAFAFEQAASDAGMVVAALRTFDEWDAHPQRSAIAAQPLVSIERIGDADPLAWPSLAGDARPLDGLRVLDLTRILAGPVGTRTLAGYGADVLMVNGPHLPNIDAIVDMSRGKRSALADLREADARAVFMSTLSRSHVFVQGYRPGSLAALGLDAQTLARERPGLVQVSLSAYGDSGVWAGKRGFDSLVQSATGINWAEAQAAGAKEPRALPMQILDIATGGLIAFGAQAALLRQQAQGGSWHVKVSLARTAQWLRELGRVPDGFAAPRADFEALMQDYPAPGVRCARRRTPFASRTLLQRGRDLRRLRAPTRSRDRIALVFDRPPRSAEQTVSLVFPHTFVPWFRTVAPHIHAYHGKTFVVGIAGELIAAGKLSSFAQDLSILHAMGIKIVLVHGFRPQVNEQLRSKGHEARYHNGLRITDAVALDSAQEAAGQLRFEIEAAFSQGLPNTPMANAIVRVVSGNFLTARPVGIVDGVDYIHSGVVRKVDSSAIRRAIDSGAMVLLSPFGFSPTGEAFNLTMEDVATSTAIALQADKLLFVTEIPGIHEDLNDNESPVDTELALADAERLLGTLPAPLKPTDTAFYLQHCVRACRGGVERSHILPFAMDGAILMEVFTHDGVGTMVVDEKLESLREATADDIGGVLQLIEPFERDGTLVKRSRTEIERDIGHYTVIEHDGVIFGCAALYPYPEAKTAEMAALTVSPQVQSQGDGERILKRVEQRARAMGLDSIFVLTTRTMHWFIKRGFAQVDPDWLPDARKRKYNWDRRSQVLVKKLS